MALTVTKMTRIFQFQGIRLPDPNPEMSVEEVKALYAAQYPELATAIVNGPEAAGDKMRSILAALRQAGIAKADLQTQNVSVYPRTTPSGASWATSSPPPRIQNAP